jgi:WD40 repeat protein/biotin carboxyl carrier protein
MRVQPRTVTLLMGSLLLAGLAGLLGCARPGGTGGTELAASDEVALTPVDIGKPLYTPTEWPDPTTSLPVAAKADPIVIPQCTLIAADKQDVASPQDGIILYVATEVPPSALAKLDPTRLVQNPETKQFYRTLREGDTVQAGQLLAQIDDRKIQAELRAKLAQIKRAEAEREVAKKIVEAADANQKMVLRAGTSSSELDRLKAKVEVDRANSDVEVKGAAIIEANESANMARVQAELHQIRAAISGVVQKIQRHRGESVKFGDTILTIYDTSRLRIEGYVDQQYALQLIRLKEQGKPLIVEPTYVEAPRRVLIGHMQPITAVAVSNQGLILSASEDRTVRVWDQMVQRRILEHPVGVKGLAASPPKAPHHFAVTGADDGRVRIWDLNSRDPLAGPIKEMDIRHQSSISCVAFAPDGSSCASACEREVLIWNTDPSSPDFGKLRYRLPPEQRGLVTAMHLLPQCVLLTVGRDNTLRLWELGQQGAKLLRVIDRRAGDVANLGVNAEGTRVLYDTGKALNVLTLPDRRTEGIIENPTDSGHFSTFALFSPNGRMVLTAGSSDGRLQLWRAPTALVRGTPLRQLAPDRVSLPTCAAFAPDNSIAVTGTQDRKVMIWNLPPADAIDKHLTATLVNIEQAVDSSARQVRITAELPNPSGLLLPGATVTLVAMPD